MRQTSVFIVVLLMFHAFDVYSRPTNFSCSDSTYISYTNYKTQMLLRELDIIRIYADMFLQNIVDGYPEVRFDLLDGVVSLPDFPSLPGQLETGCSSCEKINGCYRDDCPRIGKLLSYLNNKIATSRKPTPLTKRLTEIYIDNFRCGEYTGTYTQGVDSFIEDDYLAARDIVHFISYLSERYSS